MMNSKKWTKCIISAVSNIADEAFQRKSWFGKDNMCSSPEEDVCTLLDDFTFDKFLEENVNNLTPEELILGKELNESLMKYKKLDKDPNPIDILNDKGWDSIRVTAFKFLNILKNKQK